MPQRRIVLPSTRLIRSVSLLLVAGLLPFCSVPAHAAEIVLAGPTATWLNLEVITNSVRSAAILSETDHIVISTSEVDTCLSFLPDWSAWRTVPDGTLHVWIETVGDGSNVVSVLLGDPETPVLTVACASDWSVLPVGVFPPDEPAVPRFGVTTNRLHLVMQSSVRFGFGYPFVETRAADGPWTLRPDLVPAVFGRLYAAQAIPNWSKVGVWTAGPQAALTYLRLRWCVNGIVLIAK